MNQRFGTRVVASVAAAAMVAVLMASRAGEGQTAPAYKAPRLPHGGDVPNISGTWQVANTANWDLEDHIGSTGPIIALGAWGAVPPGHSVVEGGPIPYKPEALEKKKENFAKRLTLDPEIKCYQPGVPRAIYMPYPFRIVQTRTHVLLAFQYANASRVVDLTKVPPSPVDTWMGYSSGKWEKDTLVVDSKGFNDQSWFDRAGNHHSEALHVVERFTPVSADILNYEATIEDPNVFTRPWKISMPLYRRIGKDANFLEFNCVEFVEEMMYGDFVKKPAR